MIEKAEDFIPLWMLFSAAFGFMVGEAYGDLRRHRKCLEQTNDELRDRIEEAATDTKPIQRALKEQRGVINDIHRRLWPCQKASKNTPPKPNKINGRISPIRPCQKVNLEKQKHPPEPLDWKGRFRGIIHSTMTVASIKINCLR